MFLFHGSFGIEYRFEAFPGTPDKRATSHETDDCSLLPPVYSPPPPPSTGQQETISIRRHAGTDYTFGQGERPRNTSVVIFPPVVEAAVNIIEEYGLRKGGGNMNKYRYFLPIKQIFGVFYQLTCIKSGQ